MRILTLENEPSTSRGGQELSLFDVCSGLAERGHEIELLHTSGGDLLGRYRTFAARVDPVAAYSVDRSRSVGGVARLVRDVVQMNRTRPDLVYANQYQDSLFARLLSLRFRVPFVCHVRHTPPDRFCAQYRWGMRGPTRLIAISHWTRNEYVARGFMADRIDVVYNGVDAARWRADVPRSAARRALGLPEHASIAGYAGRLHHGKGLDVLIDSLAVLPEDWHAVIAGRNLPDGSGRDYELELRQRAAARGVEARCHFVGHLAAVTTMYAAADVVVLPSTRPEAFGRTLIEAMAAGTPVVAARIGGMPEVLTGIFERGLFPAGDVAALAARLKDARAWRAADPDLAGRCRAHVEAGFPLTKTIDGIEAVFSRVADDWRDGARGVRAAGLRFPSAAGV